MIAAVLGSALTVSTYHFMGLNKAQTIKVEHVNQQPVSSAVYTMNPEGDIIPLDFTTVAESVMDAVVHIQSTQTITANRGPYNYWGAPDPFRDLFGDDFFEEFFGPRYRYEGQRPDKPEVRIGAGSGVIISEDGYIVTNNHVIDRADDIEVTLHDNRKYKATVIGTDPSTDLALLQIKEKGLSYLPLNNSDDVKVGEWVMAVGNPFNLNSTVTAGIVSAKARNIQILRDQGAIESFIQTDAAINPGNSGGALVNLNGGLIGINTAIASPTGAYAGYGFAIPSNIVEKVILDLKEYGVVQRGFLGIWIRNVDGDLAKEKKLDVTEGVYVDSLMEKSAARDAGIKTGDVILKVDGQEVKSNPELQELIARKRPGDEVAIEVDREGKIKQFNVTLHNRDGKVSIVEKGSREISNVLGAEFQELDKKTSKELGIDGGVKITRLNAGKLRKDTNIKEGFIITKIDNKPVTSLDELYNALENKKGGVMIEGIYENIPGVYYYAFGM